MKKFFLSMVIVLSIMLPLYIVFDINKNFHSMIIEAKRIEAIDIAAHMVHDLNPSAHIGHYHTQNGSIHLVHLPNGLVGFNINDPKFHAIIKHNFSDLRVSLIHLYNTNGKEILELGLDEAGDNECENLRQLALTTKRPVARMIHYGGWWFSDLIFSDHINRIGIEDYTNGVRVYVPILVANGTSNPTILGLFEIEFQIDYMNEFIINITWKSFAIMIGPILIIIILLSFRNKIKKNLDIITTIRDMQSKFIKRKDSRINFDSILQQVLKLTKSEYGFICEYISESEKDKEHLIPYSITDISWNKKTGNLWKVHLKGGLKFYNMDTLFGAVVREKVPLLTNNATKDKRYGGMIPSGHPPLNSFLGIPLFSNTTLVGVIGVANKNGGYSESDIKEMSHISETCALLLESNKSERDKIEAWNQLKESEEKFRLVTQSTHDAIIGIDDSARISFWNRGAQKIFGFTEEEALGSNFMMLLPEEYIGGYNSACSEAIHVEKSFFVVDEKDIELFGQRKSGETFPMQVTLTIWPLKKKKIYSAIVKDITARKEIENKLIHQANYDKLTGLPNRNMLDDRLLQAEQTSRRNKSKVGVIFVDLDRFKYVNDTYGHDAGDDLLKQVSTRLKTCVREEDTVARLGGDEFLVILKDVKNIVAVRAIAKKILIQLSSTFSLTITEDDPNIYYDNKQDVNISGSVGVAFYPDDGVSKDELMKKADAAMYQAKEAGKNNYKFYTRELDEENSNRLKIETELRTALKNDEFYLMYQPIMCMPTGQLIGVEALLRWENENLGIVPPSVFVPIAEEIGLMPVLGEWIFKTSCVEMEESDVGDIYVSINVSVAQLENPDFPRKVKNILNKTNFPPELVQLEITESMIMRNVERAIHIMDQLTSIGLNVAIDDFGTGYSSLSYLKRIKASVLKIDKSFIDGLPSDGHEDEVIVKAIVSMAQSLNLSIIAEGIENPEQIDFLKGLGCDKGQGYYYHKPMSIEALLQTINKG